MQATHSSTLPYRLTIIAPLTPCAKLCIDEVNGWMCQNFLQLNKDKTEVMAFGNKDEVLKVNALHTFSLGVKHLKIKSGILVCL